MLPHFQNDLLSHGSDQLSVGIHCTSLVQTFVGKCQVGVQIVLRPGLGRVSGTCGPAHTSHCVML